VTGLYSSLHPNCPRSDSTFGGSGTRLQPFHRQSRFFLPFFNLQYHSNHRLRYHNDVFHSIAVLLLLLPTPAPPLLEGRCNSLLNDTL
jgi:hypothetical protein